MGHKLCPTLQCPVNGLRVPINRPTSSLCFIIKFRPVGDVGRNRAASIMHVWRGLN